MADVPGRSRPPAARGLGCIASIVGGESRRRKSGTPDVPLRAAGLTDYFFAGAVNSFANSPYPSASSLLAGMKRSDAEFMQ